MLAWYFALLTVFLGSATSPYTIKPAYVFCFLGVLASLLAILRPRLYLLLICAAFVALTVDFAWYERPILAQYLGQHPGMLWCAR